MTNEQALRICQQRKDDSEAPEYWEGREVLDDDPDDDWPEPPSPK